MTLSQHKAGRGIWKLTLVLYPFGAGAVAVNLIMMGLFAPLFGLPTIAPGWAVVGGAGLGLPATWAFARHVRSLMHIADAGAPTRR